MIIQTFTVLNLTHRCMYLVPIFCFLIGFSIYVQSYVHTFRFIYFGLGTIALSQYGSIAEAGEIISRHESEEQSRIAKMVLDVMSEGILTMTSTKLVKYVNPAMGKFNVLIEENRKIPEEFLVNFENLSLKERDFLSETTFGSDIDKESQGFLNKLKNVDIHTLLDLLTKQSEKVTEYCADNRLIFDVIYNDPHS